MSSALDRVMNTVELLEHVLLGLPLHLLLCARHVSQLWRELILRSKRYQRIMQGINGAPYIGVTLHIPSQCSLSVEDNAPRLTAELTLYFDKPVTIRTDPSCLTEISQLAYKYKKDTLPPLPDMFPPLNVRSYGGYRERIFRPGNDHRWTTLYPEKPHSMSWDFRSESRVYTSSNSALWPLEHSGSLMLAEIGKTYILKLRPDHNVPKFVGDKESLYARQNMEHNKKLKSCELRMPLPLVGENEVSFVVIP